MLQVRSHAQKHFIRLEKKGLGAVVPPARRKAGWGDKQGSDAVEGTADSDQEFSASHRQAGSSSSISTVDFHPPVTSASQEGELVAGMQLVLLNAYVLTSQAAELCRPVYLIEQGGNISCQSPGAGVAMPIGPHHLWQCRLRLQ